MLFQLKGQKQGWEFDLSIFDLSIWTIFKKDWPDQIDLVELWKRMTVINWSRRSVKRFDGKKTIFSMFLTVFPPFMPKDRIDPVDLWIRSTIIELIPSIFEKDQNINSIFWSNRSFDHKQRSIRTKNQWSKSQPWSKGRLWFLYKNTLSLDNLPSNLNIE